VYELATVADVMQRNFCVPSDKRHLKMMSKWSKVGLSAHRS